MPLQVVPQVVVRQSKQIIVKARFFRPPALAAQRGPTRNSGEFGGSGRETRTVMCADKPSGHLIPAFHQVSHTGVDVVDKEPMPTPLSQRFLVLLAKLPEVVKHSRNLDRLKEAGRWLCRICQHRPSPSACAVRNVVNVFGVRLGAARIIVGTGMRKQLAFHADTGTAASSIELTRLRSSSGTSAKSGIL